MKALKKFTVLTAFLLLPIVAQADDLTSLYKCLTVFAEGEEGFLYHSLVDRDPQVSAKDTPYNLHISNGRIYKLLDQSSENGETTNKKFCYEMKLRHEEKSAAIWVQCSAGKEANCIVVNNDNKKCDSASRSGYAMITKNNIHTHVGILRGLTWRLERTKKAYSELPKEAAQDPALIEDTKKIKEKIKNVRAYCNDVEFEGTAKGDGKIAKENLNKSLSDLDTLLSSKFGTRLNEKSKAAPANLPSGVQSFPILPPGDNKVRQ